MAGTNADCLRHIAITLNEQVVSAIAYFAQLGG